MNMPSNSESGVNDKRNPKSISHLLAKNTFYNLLTQGFLLLIALWSLPKIVQGLSDERFGLLSIIWAVIGYFTLLDFGISRANTKFLSEALALEDDQQIIKIIWNSIFVTGLIGIITAIIVILTAPFIINDLLKIHASLHEEAMTALNLSAISIPFMLVFGNLKGFQMALQRFDIVNIFQALMGILQWGGSVVLLWLGFGLEAIILLTVGTRILLTIGAFLILPRLVPHVYKNINLWDRMTIKKLFSFGGWLTISQIISPLFLYLDRIFIGTFLSLTAVAYYSVPQEALSRLLIVPMSLTATLFPALSEQSVLSDDENRAHVMYTRSLKYLFLFLVPLVIIFISYSSDILRIWISPEYASHSVLIFQILSVGFLFNALAQIPMTALHAYNRPDLPAKYHLIELPIMIILNLILIPWIGIIGAAIAWSMRVIMDAVLLLYGAKKCFKSLYNSMITIRFSRKIYFQLIVFTLLIIPILIADSMTWKMLFTFILFIFYGVAIWLFSFDEVDRAFLLKIFKRI